MIRYSKKCFGTYPHVNRRVVITGVGAATPLGLTLQDTWASILEGKSGIKYLEDKKTIGGGLPAEIKSDEFHAKHRMRMDDRFYTFAHFVAVQALENSGIMKDKAWTEGNKNPEKKGVLIATYSQYLERMLEFEGIRKAKVFTACPFGLQGAIALEHGMLGYQGNHQNDQIGGLKCIGDSYRLIKHGYQDMMLTGGIDRNTSGTLSRLYEEEKLFATGSERPEERIRPFDKKHSGIAIGDGGALFVLESLESAQARNAKILCEIVGYDLNSYQGDFQAPNQEGLEIVLHSVLQEAGWAPNNVCHVNASGRSAAKADQIEVDAIKRVWGTPKEDLDEGRLRDKDKLELGALSKTTVNGYKGALGHLMEAEGSVELALTVMAMQNNTVPGTVNLHDPIDKDVNFAKHGRHEKKEIEKALKISIGFGDNQVALALSKDPSGKY